jgi:hypothetical protein
MRNTPPTRPAGALEQAKAPIVGTWRIDADRSLRDISEIPNGIYRKFENLDAYRAYVKPKITGGEFEIHADGTALYRTADETMQKMTWKKHNETYWVG